jgi:hypothetical protein
MKSRGALYLAVSWSALVVGYSTSSRSLPQQPAATEPEPGECVVDDDCGLMPSQMTCCGECPPAPPFEAVPRTAIDSRLLELETDCAPQTRLCIPPVCEPVPAGCDAQAICIDHRCRLVETGCGPLVSMR